MSHIPPNSSLQSKKPLEDGPDRTVLLDDNKFLDLLSSGDDVYRSAPNDPLNPQAFRSLEALPSVGFPMVQPAHYSSSFSGFGFSTGFSDMDSSSGKKGLSLTLASSAPMDEPEEMIVVEPLPDYYEKYTSFTSAGCIGETVDAVTSVLEQDRTVQMELFRETYKIQGVVCRRNCAVHFHVNVFTTPDHCYLVEFQRRSGDAWVFSEFFSDVVHNPQVEKLLSSPAPPKKDAFAPLPLDLDDFEPQAIDSESLENLFSMASCDCVDVEREALKCLASVSGDKINHSSLVTPSALQSCVDILRKHLASNDWELQRCAATMLANLSEAVAARPQLCSALLPNAFNCLQSCSGRETRKQLVSYLHNLCETQSSELRKQEYLRVLRAQPRDVTISHLVDGILVRLSA